MSVMSNSGLPQNYLALYAKNSYWIVYNGQVLKILKLKAEELDIEIS